MRKLELKQFDPSLESLEKFKQREAAEIVVDSYEEQLKELFLIRNPRFRFIADRKKETEEFILGQLAGQSAETAGKWFFFPWSKALVHYLPDEIYQEIRTARNKNLVLADEQRKFYESTVAIAGLSVGSHAALTIAMSGGAKNIKLADPDTVSPSNLNRVRYGATAIGRNKAELAAQIIAEINPYSNIFIYDQGVTAENSSGFFSGTDGSPKADLFIEEVDNLPMKIALREQSKILKLPVIMATDNGDNVIADIERYDQNPDLALFNGAIGDLKSSDLKNLAPSEIPKIATKVAGPDMITSRMQDSLLEVGKSLYSWPQLGTAATFSGVVLCYLARRIIIGDDIRSGKYEISLDRVFESNFEDPSEKEKREAHRKEFFKAIGL